MFGQNLGAQQKAPAADTPATTGAIQQPTLSNDKAAQAITHEAERPTEDPKTVAEAELKALAEDTTSSEYPGHHNAHRMPIRVTLHNRNAEHPGQNQSVTVYPAAPELPGVIGGPQVKHALAAANLPTTARLKAHRDGQTLDPWDSLYSHAHDGDHYEVVD